MTSIGRTSTRRQSIIRPRSSAAASSPGRKPAGRSSGAVPTRWFGTMWPVWANQNRDRPVKTRPLSGISDGSTTSNADSRSDATSSNRSSLTANRSRTLPLRRNVSAGALAGDMDLGLQAIESGEDGGHVAQERGVVEAGIEVGQLEAAGHGRVESE